MNRQLSLPTVVDVFIVLVSLAVCYASELSSALRLIVSCWFWRIYGPFIPCFNTQSTWTFTSCGVLNIVFPSLYSNVKQEGGMKSYWWLVDSGAGRSMSSNIEDFVYLEPWTGGKVQVGSGEVMDVTHRGIIQLYARGRDGKVV